MKRIVITMAVAMNLAACSGAAPTEVNACAIKGATYLVQFAELGSGTCGPIPSQIWNATPSESAEEISCENSATNGCSIKHTKCQIPAAEDGIACEMTSALDFKSDGSGARGLATFTCVRNKEYCSSTYDVLYTRQ